MKKLFLLGLFLGIVSGVSTAGLAQSQEDAAAPNGAAKEMKPVLTVSFAGFNAVRKDLRLLAQASGDPQLMLTLILMGNQGLPGLDVDRPWGTVVQTDGREYPAFTFVPVTDLPGMIERMTDFERLLRAMQQSGGSPFAVPGQPPGRLDEAPRFGEAPKFGQGPKAEGSVEEASPEPDEAAGDSAPDPDAPEAEMKPDEPVQFASLISGPDDDGVYQIAAPGGPIYLQAKNGWAFATADRETLARLPEDPAALLEGLNESHTIAARITLANLPPDVRENILSRIRKAADRPERRMPDETPWQYVLRKLFTPQSAQDVARWLEEAATVELGLGVDPDSMSVRLQGKLTAIEGTSTAEELALFGQATSNLTGLFAADDDAVLTALAAGPTSERHAARVKEIIQSFGARAAEDLDRRAPLSQSDLEQAQQGLKELIDLVRQTVDARRIDAGTALLPNGNGLVLLAGSTVADTARLEQLFKGAVELAAKNEPRVAEVVTLDAETYQGVRLHTISVPAVELPQLENLPAGLLGDQFTAAVGFGPQNAYLAVGPGALDHLKKAIDRSQTAAGEAVPPLRISMSAGELGRIVDDLAIDAGWDLSSRQISKILPALVRAGPNDRVTIAVEEADGGVQASLDMEYGVTGAGQAALMALIREFMSGRAGDLFRGGALPQGLDL